jgi:hypothetical protein
MVDHPSASGVQERIDDEGHIAGKFRRNFRHENHAHPGPRGRVPREVGDRPIRRRPGSGSARCAAQRPPPRSAVSREQRCRS